MSRQERLDSLYMSLIRSVAAWFNSEAADPNWQDERIDWARILPFIGLHLACLAVIWVGVSWIAVLVALASYAIRMFAITAFYHRYFSHRTFRTSRPIQFLFALIGASATPRLTTITRAGAAAPANASASSTSGL